MAAPVPAPAAVTAEPRWGLPDAAIGWVVAQCCALVLGTVVLAATGNVGKTSAELSLGVTAVLTATLWVGFIGVPLLVAATKGRGLVADFRVRIQAIDVPIGAVAGLAAQFLLVPLLALPVIWLSGTSFDELGEPAQRLADKASTPAEVLVFFLFVGIGAPIAEEIFFRGLLLRSIEKRFGTTVGLVGSSVLFGATHFQALQFLPLVGAGLVFGYLTVRSGRLGPGIVAHMAFNTATVVLLVLS